MDAKHLAGILGREIVLELAREPQQWHTVHALSRSKKEDYPPNVVHRHLDLVSPVQDMTKDLAGVDGEYVFFAAYLQRDSEPENWKVNGRNHPAEHRQRLTATAIR